MKNPSAITSWQTSRQMSSSGRLNTLSASERLTMPTRQPWASTTGRRLSRCLDISRATSLTSSSGLVVTAGLVMRSPAVSSAVVVCRRRGRPSPVSSASRSASDTTPTTAPWSSTTGKPLTR